MGSLLNRARFWRSFEERTIQLLRIMSIMLFWMPTIEHFRGNDVPKPEFALPYVIAMIGFAALAELIVIRRTLQERGENG